MTYELMIALTVFAFVATVSPGPNNLMLMASGANFGFRRSVPHMAGIGIGFAVMIALVGVGLMGIFETWPVTNLILKVLGTGYMCWLAWKIANSAPPEKAEAEAKPLSFMQAALFQWVNPKAWAMGMTAISIYTPDHDLLSVLTVALIFGLVAIPSVSLWTLIGQQIRRVLNNPLRLRLFNGTMAVLLVMSLYPILMT
ncbi:LysE family translocator [Amaricoccus tamworthensis]|uniref:LysE family translocator n=1 Tax=Amaricoccus tamworthensis TaxID=57002 RepID=UPI003C7C3DCF